MTFKGFKKRFYTSFLLLVLLTLIFFSNYIMGLSLIIFSVLSILEFLNLSNKIFFKKKIFYFVANIFFIFYVFLLSCFIFIFSLHFNLKIFIFLILLSCIASDIGGYIIGNIFKGPKLSKISPNKTMSGSVGSIIFSSFTILILSNIIFMNLNYIFLIVGIFSSISCQLGDLFFSYIKRKAKLKDTGNFLPGHGGILDRLDGILVGLPIGFITLILLFK